jgi:hypothetical protein
MYMFYTAVIVLFVSFAVMATMNFQIHKEISMAAIKEGYVQCRINNELLWQKVCP